MTTHAETRTALGLELSLPDPDVLFGLEDPTGDRGRRCSAVFKAANNRRQRVDGVYLGRFVDDPPEIGGTGRLTHRLLGDDGQAWENEVVRWR